MNIVLSGSFIVISGTYLVLSGALLQVFSNSVKYARVANTRSIWASTSKSARKASLINHKNTPLYRMSGRAGRCVTYGDN